jgi:hypothetical protein
MGYAAMCLSSVTRVTGSYLIALRLAPIVLAAARIGQTKAPAEAGAVGFAGREERLPAHRRPCAPIMTLP